MKEIGLQAYRLSVSWPRVMPGGAGAVNQKGLDFYDRLIDELLAAKITPYVTLFHWDFPYELYCRGGWLNPDSSNWFAEYAKVVVKKLSDRVQYWMTLNEPQCFIGFGQQEGIQAPGDRLGFTEVLRAGHNALLAHGKAVQAIRANSKLAPRIGWAAASIVSMPATKAPRDIEAARRAMFSITEKTCSNNTWWMDPVYLGRYPDDGLKLFGECAPEIRDEDLEIIHQPLDFFGVNIYTGQKVRSGKDDRVEGVPLPLGQELTAYRWAVTPESLYWGPKFFRERYKLPIVITENGMSNVDWVSLDGKVHDPQRIDFMKRYLVNLEKAIEEGVDVRGYFHWSIMDNFEWAQGFKERFGLIYVDYPTQKRILKDSAYWYKELIASNGAALQKS